MCYSVPSQGRSSSSHVGFSADAGMSSSARIGIVQPSAYFLEAVLNVRRSAGILSEGYVRIYVSILCLVVAWTRCQSSHRR